MKTIELKSFLDEQVLLYNSVSFIEHDPVKIPRAFDKKEDQELIGFFAAILAWGQRKTIISKSIELIDRMNGEPYIFIKNYSDKSFHKIEGFKHRTFNDTDLDFLIKRLKFLIDSFSSLEQAFVVNTNEQNIKNGLIRFRNLIFECAEPLNRTKKHIASPAKNAACKRLNMYLRWMVRSDNAGVDLGIWQKINPSQLVMPIDVHVERVAAKLGLLTTKKIDWAAAEELTETLKTFDPSDPVKYDFALFGLGVSGKY